MGRGEFDDIVEECLSALLEGRRTIEESLSLYPAWRGRLEPLLRAAAEIAGGLDVSPSPHARERGLQRFLDSARARRRLRALLSPQAVGTPWWRWASTGLAGVVVIGMLALISATLMADEGQRFAESVSVKPYSPAPRQDVPLAAPESSLEVVQERVAALEESVRQGEPVGIGLLGALTDANNDLAEDLDGPGEIPLVERVAAVSIASKQYELLQELQEQSSGSRALAVQESLDAATDVLEKLGAAPTPSPSASPSPEPTTFPTGTPGPQPSATPTTDATATPFSSFTPAP